jgi:hypothetical protein
MSSRFRPACAAFAALTTFTTIGCVDPQKSFDDYGERVPDASPVADAGGGIGVFDISGAFLLTIETSAGIIRFVVEGELRPNEDGTATADLTLQAITTARDNCPNDAPGEPVGDPLALTGVEITGTGSFEVMQTGAAAPGPANPLCLDIVANITFTGALQSEDLFCGTVDVVLTEPPVGELAGTFGATRIAAPGEKVQYGDDNLPDVVTSCP